MVRIWLTGKRAFQGKTHLSIVSEILEKDPAPLNVLQPLPPPALESAVRKCLAKDPEERWQNARDLVSELRWIIEAVGTSVTAAGNKGVAIVRKRELLYEALAIICLVAAIIGAASHWRLARTRERTIVAEIVLTA